MKDSFITGSFLSGRASVFGYKERQPAETPSFTEDQLTSSFARRASRFEQRKHGYMLTIQGGAIAAILLMVAAFRIPFGGGETLQIQQVEQELVQMEDVAQTVQQVLPPPPPRPPVPVEVPNDEILEDEELDLDAALDIDEPMADLPPPPPTPFQEEEVGEPEVFIAVEQMPEMIGGMPALLKDLKYPDLARRAGLEGTVVVKIVVDEEGRPYDASVLRSVHEVLDKEAVEAVLKQRFKPGRQRNKAVRVSISIPVRFQLRG